MEIFVKIEIEVTCKRRFPGKPAFTVFVIASVVPHGIAAIEISPDIIWHIRNDQLCFLDGVALPPLHTVVV